MIWIKWNWKPLSSQYNKFWVKLYNSSLRYHEECVVFNMKKYEDKNHIWLWVARREFGGSCWSVQFFPLRAAREGQLIRLVVESVSIAQAGTGKFELYRSLKTDDIWKAVLPRLPEVSHYSCTFVLTQWMLQKKKKSYRNQSLHRQIFVSDLVKKQHFMNNSFPSYFNPFPFPRRETRKSHTFCSVMVYL